jgi:histidinol-phosphate aminotransferase
MVLPNGHLLGIHRVVERMHERSNLCRLDRNERVTPFAPDEFRAMLATLTPEHFCAYPDPAPLYARLSRAVGLPEDHLYLTNGSDAAIRMVFQTYVRPGDTVVFPDPSYAMYGIYAQVFQARSAVVRYGNDLTLDVDQVRALVESGSRLLALANPDQPTGAVLPQAAIEELALAAERAGSLLIVDEAYYPFHRRTAVDLILKSANLVVTRTFSKWGGLAGLRLGFLVAQPEIIKHVERIRGAHEVNAVAIAIACYVLDHPEVGEAYLAAVQAGRDVLARGASRLGLGFPPCPTNFQLLRIPGAANTEDLVAALRRHGFLVKGRFSAPAIRDCIRVTLAGPEVMERFVRALEASLGGG